MPKHVLIIPTFEDGDTRVEFAIDNEAEIAAAMEKFDDLVKNHKHVAVALGANGRDNRILRSFDPTVERTVFMPQRQGG